MKHIFLIFLIIGFGILTYAQTQYEVSSDGTNKILKGIISKDLIVRDTSFAWFQQSQAGYTPDASTVAALKAKGSLIELLVFGGTWCDDTKDILPKFFAITDAASFPENRITLVGVDHNKKAINNSSETMNITNVPTFIVMSDGKEVGRVVEYGKRGQWDKEIGEVINLVK